MGVSRTVIREAIRVLSDRGLVRARSGCGTYVQELSPRDAAASIELFLKLKNGPRSFRDVYEVRRMIEAEAAGLAAQRATAADHQAMADAIEGMQAHQDDPEQYTQYDVAFHSAVVAATHNELLSVLLSPISDLLLEVVRVSLDVTNAAEQGLTFHRQVLEHIRAGDAAGARQYMREHIEHAHRLVQAAQHNA
jgi:GntR family transcriptional repressor for pyruvate dehydrogenase complex